MRYLGNVLENGHDDDNDDEGGSGVPIMFLSSSSSLLFVVNDEYDSDVEYRHVFVIKDVEE
jgi:hypothetical protein